MNISRCLGGEVPPLIHTSHSHAWRYLRSCSRACRRHPRHQVRNGQSYIALYSQTVYNTKGTRAHTHRELIRKWLWEPKGSSLEYI